MSKISSTKRLLSVILSLLLILSSVPLTLTASAATTYTSGYLTYTVSNGEATITDCKTTISGSYTIPDTLGGYPVTAIGDSAFFLCQSLTSITIPDSVTTIGDRAFSSCSSLRAVTLGSNVTSIGARAFSYCKSLTNITIPDSVTAIGEVAFNSCKSLTKITVDEYNKYYSSDSQGVLYNKDKTELICCPCGLTSCTIPDSVTSIDDYAFYGYYITLTSITVDENNKYYSSDEYGVLFNKDKTELILFPTGSSLTSYSIPDSVTVIGNSAFEYCTSLKSVTIPDSVVSIGDSAFYGCDLTSVTIGNGVTSIGDYAFDGCNFTRITIGNSVTTIGECAFFNCSLESVTIPGSVTSIGSLAFGYYGGSSLFLIDGFTIYGYTGTAAETYANKNGIPFVFFEAEKYKADYILSYNVDTMESNCFNVDNYPAADLLQSAKDCGINITATFWDKMNDAVGLLVDSSSMMDLAVEEKDAYEAILWDIFEASTNKSSVISSLNSGVNDCGKEVLDLVTSTMTNLDNFDAYNNINISDMTQSQIDDFAESLKDALETNYPTISGVMDASKAIGQVLSISKDVEEAANTVAAYIMMYQLSESTKQVMEQMYQSCSSNNAALKAALLNCIAIMNTNEAGLWASVAAVVSGTAVKDIAQVLIGKMWDDIKASVMTAHPAAFAFLAAYKSGVFLSNAISNTDAITEAYFKLSYIVDIQNLAKNSYFQLKSDYEKDPTNDKAAVYNSAIDIMFNAMDEGCDVSIEFVDAIAESKLGMIDTLLGNTTTTEKKEQIESTQNYAFNIHENVVTDWVNRLKVDFPEEYPNYENLITESNARIYKRYNIDCPVDVYIYDLNDELVASAVGSDVYTADDAKVIIYNDGEDKTVYINDDEEYSISYIGNGNGSMDITVTEYDEQEKTKRTVYFDDLPLQKGTEYSSVDSGEVDTYSIESENGTIYADYDSNTSTEIDTHLLETLNKVLTSGVTATTEEPTTAEPTTAEPTISAPEFAANDESVVIDEDSKQVTLPAETGTEDFKQLITIGSFSVTDAEGNALSEDALIGTGCKIQLLDGEGNVVSEYTVIVLSDVDGNGKITAADARLALRTAAQLDTLEGVYAIAADFDADSAIKPSDARSILRVAAKLD